MMLKIRMMELIDGIQIEESRSIQIDMSSWLTFGCSASLPVLLEVVGLPDGGLLPPPRRRHARGR